MYRCKYVVLRGELEREERDSGEREREEGGKRESVYFI